MLSDSFKGTRRHLDAAGEGDAGTQTHGLGRRENGGGGCNPGLMVYEHPHLNGGIFARETPTQCQAVQWSRKDSENSQALVFKRVCDNYSGSQSPSCLGDDVAGEVAEPG